MRPQAERKWTGMEIPPFHDASSPNDGTSRVHHSKLDGQAAQCMQGGYAGDATGTTPQVQEQECSARASGLTSEIRLHERRSTDVSAVHRPSGAKLVTLKEPVKSRDLSALQHPKEDKSPMRSQLSRRSDVSAVQQLRAEQVAMLEQQPRSSEMRAAQADRASMLTML